ncbi:PhoPQ-activated protein PqaA family protein [Thiolapillus sp.]
MKWLLGFVSAGALLVAGLVFAEETALDRYVNKDDGHYSWEYVGSDKDTLQKTYFLKLVSQQWRDANEVDRPVWEHEVIIAVPEILSSHGEHTAVLVIEGGRNGGKPITDGEDAIGVIANALGSVVATVLQVPNQPLYFADETDNARTEDEILAYSMDKFLATGDEEWPVHLAMTKSVVRAMDAIQEFLGRKDIRIDDFVLLGGSKRGWTAWLTAAVDPRVKAIMPISADLLNLKNQFNRHWNSYGFYAPALVDYAGFDLGCRLQSVRGKQLSKIIDPYYYRDRYTMPKLLINSMGDQFFITDSASLYYDQLPEPKLLRNTFNTDHRQGEAESQLELLQSALLWVDDVNKDKTPPEFHETVLDDGTIRLETGKPRPDRVYLWQATNPEARDFRLEEIGPAWRRTRLSSDGDGVYLGKVEAPETGYIAYALELRYDEDNFAGLLDISQYYTTQVQVRPETFPFAGTACLADTRGNLENPAQGSFQSGISVISGWACDAENIEIELDDEFYLGAGYGARRADTQKICGDADNGFGLLYNLNLQGDGLHKVRALTDGRVIGSTEFTVTTLGAPFRRGLSGVYQLSDFPEQGQSVSVTWQQSQQNFAISATSSAATKALIADTPQGVAANTTRGNLENPADGSSQSGIAIISGWICEADDVVVEMDGVRTFKVAYGTRRADTVRVCGDADNGFSLLYNINLLGEGAHTLRVLADGIEIDRSNITVTTFGDDFLKGASGQYRLTDFPETGEFTDIRWDQSRQNFLIRGYAPKAQGQ